MDPNETLISSFFLLMSSLSVTPICGFRLLKGPFAFELWKTDSPSYLSSSLLLSKVASEPLRSMDASGTLVKPFFEWFSFITNDLLDLTMVAY